VFRRVVLAGKTTRALGGSVTRGKEGVRAPDAAPLTRLTHPTGDEGSYQRL